VCDLLPEGVTYETSENALGFALYVQLYINEVVRAMKARALKGNKSADS
jgi:hypothetical protein